MSIKLEWLYFLPCQVIHVCLGTWLVTTIKNGYGVRFSFNSLQILDTIILGIDMGAEVEKLSCSFKVVMYQYGAERCLKQVSGFRVRALFTAVRSLQKCELTNMKAKHPMSWGIFLKQGRISCQISLLCSCLKLPRSWFMSQSNKVELCMRWGETLVLYTLWPLTDTLGKMQCTWVAILNRKRHWFNCLSIQIQ